MKYLYWTVMDDRARNAVDYHLKTPDEMRGAFNILCHEELF